MKDFWAFLMALVAVAAVFVIVNHGNSAALVAKDTLGGVGGLITGVESGGSTSVQHEGATGG